MASGASSAIFVNVYVSNQHMLHQTSKAPKYSLKYKQERTKERDTCVYNLSILLHQLLLKLVILFSFPSNPSLVSTFPFTRCFFFGGTILIGSTAGIGRPFCITASQRNMATTYSWWSRNPSRSMSDRFQIWRSCSFCSPVFVSTSRATLGGRKPPSGPRDWNCSYRRSAESCRALFISGC